MKNGPNDRDAIIEEVTDPVFVLKYHYSESPNQSRITAGADCRLLQRIDIDRTHYYLSLLCTIGIIMFLFYLCVCISDAGARSASGAGEGRHGCPCDASLQWREI